MQNASIDSVMSEGEGIRLHIEMGESVDILSVRHIAVGWLQLACIRPATARNNVRGESALEFEVLKIMIMAAKVGMHVMFLKKRFPFFDQRPGITMIPV